MVIPLGDRFNQIVHLIDQERRQAGRQGAQADAVRADDRPRSGRGGRRQARGRAFQEVVPEGRSPGKMIARPRCRPDSRMGQTPRSRRDAAGSIVSRRSCVAC